MRVTNETDHCKPIQLINGRNEKVTKKSKVEVNANSASGYPGATMQFPVHGSCTHWAKLALLGV